MSKTSQKVTILILGVLLAILLCVGFFVRKGQAAQLDRMDARIEEMRTQIQAKERIQKQSVAQALAQVNDQTVERRSSDDEVAKTFFQYLFSWQDWESYEAVRQGLVDQYHLDPQSQVLTAFMAPVKNEVLKGQDGQVKNYNDIDLNGVKVEFKDMASYVTGVTGQNYEYHTFVRWYGNDNRYKTTGESEALFTYVVTPDGQLLDVYAYVFKS